MEAVCKRRLFFCTYELNGKKQVIFLSKIYLCSVKLVVRNILFIALVVCSVHQVQASRVSKGFEALKMMDYFKAKKMFTKGLKYNPEVSSYGLSIIFSRNDNPFYNLDSAYRYVVMADTTWANAKDRKKGKMAALWMAP